MVVSQKPFMQKQRRRPRSKQVEYDIHKVFYVLGSADPFTSSTISFPEASWVSNIPEFGVPYHG